jgi:thiamine pyrophosphokinase
MPSKTQPLIELSGRGRRPRRHGRAVVIALTGASTATLARAFVLAAPHDPRPLLIAVDGGLATCRRAGKRPDHFVGDLDSIVAAPKGVPATIFPVDKSFSDFAGALVQARRLRADVAVIAGLLGGRLDHEWANLLEMGAAAPRWAGLIAPTTRGLVIVTAGELRVSGVGRRLASVFALAPDTCVSLRGTRWPLSQRRLAAGSLGLSNVTGGAIELEVHAGAAALVLPGRRG